MPGDRIQKVNLPNKRFLPDITHTYITPLNFPSALYCSPLIPVLQYFFPRVPQSTLSSFLRPYSSLFLTYFPSLYFSPSLSLSLYVIVCIIYYILFLTLARKQCESNRQYLCYFGRVCKYTIRINGCA